MDTMDAFDRLLKLNGLEPDKINEDLYFSALDVYGEEGTAGVSRILGRKLKPLEVTDNLIKEVAAKKTVENKAIDIPMNTEKIVPRSVSYEMMNAINPPQLDSWAEDIATQNNIDVAGTPVVGNKNTWREHIGSIKTDLLTQPYLNAGIGAGSIALSQMQGRGVIGTSLNLAGAMGGSMLGNQYLGKFAGGATPSRLIGGLAGHTIANILMGLFRDPQEQQLLNQGMQYSQQQNGGMG
jgi:hypothetical protein